MAYIVKWVAGGQTKVYVATTAYSTPSKAIDFACTILKQRPENIWIEGPNGLRIERDKIKANCEVRGIR